MTTARPTTQPHAQPDVPRSDSASVVPGDGSPEGHSEDGPVKGALAEAVNDLRNTVSAIGPVNFLPKEWPAAELDILRQATAIVQRLVDANNAVPTKPR